MTRSDQSAHTHDDVLRLATDPSAGRATAEAGPPPGEKDTPDGKPPRIEDVAREAGVSPITVSRALRSPHMVSPKTRDRILEVVARTGYWSNPHAAALRSGRSTIVAAFVSNMLSQQYSIAARACARVLEEHGYQVMVGQTSYSYERELAAVQSLRALRPAAVFFTGVIELEENRSQLRKLDIPIVESWAFPRDPLDMLVGFSNTDGGRLAASHLVARGYRRLAYIGRQGGRGSLRLAGFRERVAALGAEVVETIRVERVESILDGRRAYQALVDAGKPFDAVFCANDLLGIGTLLEARQQGRRIPEDLAVLAFGDNDLAGELTPRLSMVAFDSQALGARAGRMIASRLGGDAPDPQIDCVDLLLKQGEST